MAVPQIVGLLVVECKGHQARGPRPLLLEHVRVDVLVVDRMAQHTQTQVYRSTEALPVETKYVFPLPESASVSGFSATFAATGRRMDGIVERRPEARRRYDEAAQRGDRAALLEEERPDVFATSVGCLEPCEEVTIVLEYCLELPVEAGAVRLTVPAHVGQRYAPHGDSEGAGLAREAASFAAGGAARLSASIACQMGASGLDSVSSPTHKENVVVAYDPERPGDASVNLEAAALYTDLVIIFKPKDLFRPVVAWEEWPEHGTHAIMVSLVPKFELPKQRVEAIFLLDCSGSMRGGRIEQSKRSMQIFLRSLPAGSLFNIAKFGTSFKRLFNASVSYTEETLADATAYVDDIAANMGGTNILPALQALLACPTKAGFARQVFVLTDGQVSNEQEVILAVRSCGHRIFSMGVGSGVSTFLVTGLAQATDGHAVFVQDGERLEPACISLLRKALTPAITNLKITWPLPTEDGFILAGDDTSLSSSVAGNQPTPAATVLSFFDPSQNDPRAFHSSTLDCKRQQAPARPPALAADRNFCAFALYSADGLPVSPSEVVLAGETPFGRMALKVPLPAQPVRREAPLLHRAAARALIRDLEEADAAEAPSAAQGGAEALSLRFQVLCRSTAFVAVDAAEGCRLPVSYAVPVPTAAGAGRCGQPLRSRSRSRPDGHRCRRRVAKARTAPEEVSLEAGSIQAGSIVIIKGRPSVVSEVMHSKTGKHGHAKVHITALDEATGERLEDLCPASQAMEVPVADGGEAPSSDTDSVKRLKERRKKKSKKEKTDKKTTKRDAQEAPEARSTEELDSGSLEALEALLRLAAADGSFGPCGALEQLIGTSLEEARPRCRALWGREPAERALATLLALAVLRRVFGPHEASWQLVAEKAADWLQERASTWRSEALPDVQAAVRAAEAMLEGAGPSAAGARPLRERAPER